MPTVFRLLSAALVFALAACSPDRDEAPAETPPADTELAAPEADIDGTPVLAIETVGGEARVGLTDAVLYVQLTEQVAADVDERLGEAEDEGGLSGMIAGAVSGMVVGALTTPIQFPLADIRRVSHEDGRLDIEFEDESRSVGVSVDDQPVDQRFDPDDAERFVEAFDKVKAESAQQGI